MFNSRMDRLGQANMLMHIHAILLLKRIWPLSPLEPSHAAAPSKALWETLEWKSWQQLENKKAVCVVLEWVNRASQRSQRQQSVMEN